MTQNELQIGNEITREIENLKGALMEVSKSKLFNVADSACSPYGYKTADAFLSVLDTEVKNMAIRAINDRLQELERKFTEL